MTATISENVQQQVLGAVRKSQEITLDAIKQAVETVNAATAKLPAVPLVGKLPQLPPVSGFPGTRRLPAPEAVVSATFDFVDRLVAEQRKFAGELVRATASLRPAAKAAPAEDEAPAAQPAGTGSAQEEAEAEGTAPAAE
jgi:hypothetical protein